MRYKKNEPIGLVLSFFGIYIPVDIMTCSPCREQCWRSGIVVSVVVQFNIYPAGGYGRWRDVWDIYLRCVGAWEVRGDEIWGWIKKYQKIAIMFAYVSKKQYLCSGKMNR